MANRTVCLEKTDMNILEFLRDNIVYLDGGMGTMLQAQGLRPGELPERWNLTHPETIIRLHREYFEAGSNVINTNTFGANSLKMSSGELEETVQAALENAQKARRKAAGGQEKYIALDIGPTGKLMRPFGDFDFEEAVRVFAETIRLGAKYGAELIMIETMNDSYETKAAVLAAKENSSLPIFVSNAYGEDGKLMTGATPGAMTAMLEGLGADAVGINCSFGPKELAPVAEEYLKYASLPVILKPNAGLPKERSGRTVYDVLPEEFAEDVARLAEKGVRIVGGCCGTTPEYIEALVKRTKGLVPVRTEKKHRVCASSYTHAVEFGARPVLIGERINPTGKKRFQQALRENDVDYILSEGIAQQERGAQILDVNVGVPGIDEAQMLEQAVLELQSVIDLPLQIDTSDSAAMERALRRYNGKAVINSVNGKQESMEAVFPLAKKYGGLVIALTLDEKGIPATAEGRVQIARRILKEAEKYGIERENIVFDPLTMTVSADAGAAETTLAALERIERELKCHTVLGVSNVSFGLPDRDGINSVFFALAMGKGLSAAIMNPYSYEMMKTWHVFLALSGKDENFSEYIRFSAGYEKKEIAVKQETEGAAQEESGSRLQRAIEKGLKEQAAECAAQLLEEREPLEIVQEEIIPALDVVGKGFEKKTIYLPQLLMSAEAAKSAFEKLKAFMAEKKERPEARGRFVIATVKGDIHDIGKNIVKLLLENYGFDVTDLGRDVAPEKIVETVQKLHAPLVGLSALMTTTVPAMEETIRQLRESAPWCRIVVGGAVLTQEYADRIGADQYAKDAMETVRYAEKILAGEC